MFKINWNSVSTTYYRLACVDLLTFLSDPRSENLAYIMDVLWLLHVIAWAAGIFFTSLGLSNSKGALSVHWKKAFKRELLGNISFLITEGLKYKGNTFLHSEHFFNEWFASIENESAVRWLKWHLNFPTLQHFLCRHGVWSKKVVRTAAICYPKRQHFYSAKWHFI